MKDLFGVRSLFCSLFLSFMLFTPLFVQDIFAQKAMEEDNIVIFKSNGYYMVCDGKNSFSAISDKSALKLNALWEIKKRTSDSQLYLMNIGNSLLLSTYNKPITYAPEDVNSASTIYNYGSTWYFPYYPQRPYLSDNNEWKFSSSYGDANAIFMTIVEEQAGNGNITSSVYNAADTTCAVSYTGGTFDLRDLITIVRTTIASGEKDVYYVNDESISPGENIRIFKETIISGEGNGEPVTEYLHPETLDVAVATSIAGQSVEGYKLTIPQNNTVLERSAVVNITISLNGETITRKITFTQSANTTLVNAYEFIHSSGQANAGNVAGLQQVHEHEDVIYALDGETKHLKLQLADGAANYLRGFYRWFDYNMDATVTSGLNFTVNSYKPTSNDKGVYILAQTVPGRTTYTMDGNSKKIACDISQYADYVDNATNKTLIEPTLSYRMIYDIRPASEMAAKLDECSSTPLETYKILAPAGKSIRISPEYRWMGGEEYVNYYYTSGGNVVRLSDPQWYKNGALMTIGGTGSSVYDNRLLEVTASSTVGNVDVYELKTPTGLIIAQFNVLSKAMSEVGPVIMNASTKKAIKSDAELDKSYNLAAFRNFDFTDETGVLYSKPMIWDESTYGFAYTTGEAGDKKQLTNGFADWSEYTFIRNTGTTWSWLSSNVTDQSSGDGTGYFLYIDANEMPGKVADLRINGDLCPNTSIWISTWIIDLNSQNESNVTSPNLNFIVTGIDAIGEEHQIVTYTTGQFDRSTRGNWHQVLFEVKLDEMSYAYYRLRIDNNGASAIGNDFGIDNIRIYTSKPAVMGIQAMKGCTQTESNVAIMRIDYNKTGVINQNTGDIYYRWIDSNSGDVLNLDYLGTNQKTYGKVSVNKAWNSNNLGGNTYYESLAYFLNNVDLEENEVVEFYTTETCKYEDGTEKTHLVLYVIHNSTQFKTGKRYTSQVMVGKADFAHIECASENTFQVVPRNRLVLNNTISDEFIHQSLAPATYTVAVRIYGTNVNTGLIDSINCYADWLKIPQTLSPKEKETHINLLKGFRENYPSGTDLDFKTYIDGLKDKEAGEHLYEHYKSGELLLNKNVIEVEVSKRGDPITYVAIPIAANSNNSFTICPIPLEITMRSGIFIVLANPEDEESFENMPKAVQGSSCVIRISENDVQKDLPLMDIDYIDKEMLNIIEGEHQNHLLRIILCETNDEEYQDEAVTNSYHVFDLQHVDENGVVLGTDVADLKVDDLLKAVRVSNSFVMKAGKYYQFHSMIESVNGVGIVPAFNFDVYVVPNVVVWNPTLHNTAWHNDANWKTKDGASAFIPLVETDVIIKGDAEIMPVLPEDPTVLLGSGADQYLKYDVGADFNSCRNIYFEAGAKLARHDKLNYTGKVYVDMPFENNDGATFELKSVPLNGVVSGDFYVPRAGDKTAFDFSELASVDTRVANKFVQKTFSASVKQYAGGKDTSIVCTGSEWSSPTNALTMPWQVGRGYAIAKQTTTVNQDFVRLPKVAQSYCFYYDNNGQEGELSFTATKIDRGGNAGKLSYTGGDYNIILTNDVEGNIFLIGNPFMCDMSICNFLNENANINGRFYYEYVDDMLKVVWVEHNQSNDPHIVPMYIAPMDAVFVMTKESIKELNVKFDSGMMYFNEYNQKDNEETQPLVKRTKLNSIDEILTITANRNGKISKANIRLSSDATNEYSTEEDAPLLLLASELTPFAIYSIAGNQAMAYNSLSDIYMIPLSINVIDGEEMGDITFEFSGVDNLSQYVYLYDSYEDRYISLAEGDVFNYDVEENQEVRYYITSRRAGDVTTELDESMIETVKVLNLGEGQMMIYASENINSLNVYDLTGKLIVSETNINAPQHNITLPQNNVYIFEIITESTVSNQKVATK